MYARERVKQFEASHYLRYGDIINQRYFRKGKKKPFGRKDRSDSIRKKSGLRWKSIIMK